MDIRKNFTWIFIKKITYEWNSQFNKQKWCN